MEHILRKIINVIVFLCILHTNYRMNKLAKLGDAIAISNLKLSPTHPLTDRLTGVGARRWCRI